MEAQSVTLGPDDRTASILRAKRRAASFRIAIIVAVHLAVIVIWQLSVDLFRIPAFILPSPLRALKTLASPSYAWPMNTLV